MKLGSLIIVLTIASSEISLGAGTTGSLSQSDLQAAARAATGPAAPATGSCNGLTVGGQNLDTANPKRLKKLERWCGKGGKGGGTLHQDLAKLKKQFMENSCADLTNGGKGMTGAKATNLDIKGMIAKAEKRLQETCGAYQRYAGGASDLCRQYGAAGAEVRSVATNSTGGSNQRSLCDAAKTSATSASKLSSLEKRAAGLGRDARKVKGLKSFDDVEMRKNLEDLEVFTKMTMKALDRQAKMKMAARKKEAATSSGGDAIRFARSSDVKAFYKRMGACQEAVKTVKPFMKSYRSLASDLNYFQLEAQEMENNFKAQRMVHGARTSELASRSDKLNSGGQGGACAASLSPARGESRSGRAGAPAGNSAAPAGEKTEKVASEKPKPRSDAAAASPAPTGGATSASPKVATAPNAETTQAPGAGNGGAATGRAPASTSQPAAPPLSEISAEAFPPSDQAAFRAGRENLRLSPMQAGESNNAYAQRVVGARPVGGVITISNGTRWQTYTGGKLQDRRMLLPVASAPGAR